MKFGADTPEIADTVLDEHGEQPRTAEQRVGSLIGTVAAILVGALVLGGLLLALSGTIYGLYRMLAWIVGWF